MANRINIETCLLVSGVQVAKANGSDIREVQIKVRNVCLVQWSRIAWVFNSKLWIDHAIAEITAALMPSVVTEFDITDFAVIIAPNILINKASIDLKENFSFRINMARILVRTGVR